MKRAGKTIECFNDIRKYLFEHKVPAVTFIRDGKTETLYTQMYIDEKDKEIERLKKQNNDLRKIYRNTYKRLFKNGNDELARYFQAQIDDCPIFYVEPIIDYAKEYKIYKSRCEKAMKFMEDTFVVDESDKCITELYEILQGSDKK